MSIYSKKSRDIFVVGQVATASAMGQPFTTYNLVKVLDNTPPTSRKILNGLVEDGLLLKEKEDMSLQTVRYIYTVSPLGQLFLIGNKVAYMAQLETLWMEHYGGVKNE